MPYNPFRYPKHFQLDDYTEAGWDEIDAKLYLDAIQQSFELPNAVMDLRVPYALQSSEDKRGFFRAYVHHFNEFYRRVRSAVSDEEEMNVMETVIADLHEEIQEWIDTHDVRVPSSPTYWTGEIEEIYRRSMGIPLRAEPKVTNEVPIAVAISVLSVGAVLIIASGIYVMRTRKHSIFKLIKGLFNPVVASIFELTMIVFDVSGDVLAFVLVVRKDETVGDAFKITYGGICAFALGMSLIAIVVSVVRIKQELALVKEKSDETKEQKPHRSSSTKTESMRRLDSVEEEDKEEEEEASLPPSAATLLPSGSGTDESHHPIPDLEQHSTMSSLLNENRSFLPTSSIPHCDESASAEEEKEPPREGKLERRKSSFSGFIIGLHKDDDKDKAETQLVFAESFVNLLLLVFEDFPMAIMNMIYIMHFSGGNVSFSALYMMSFAGGLILLGFKFSKLREVEAIEETVDRTMSFMSIR